MQGYRRRLQRADLQPIHQLRPAPGQAPSDWISEGNDPQFVISGPFEPGLVELRFVAAAPDRPAYGRAQIYYAPAGEFREDWSVSFPALARTADEHRLRFLLPFRAATLRFDPLDCAGQFRLETVYIACESRLRVAARRAFALAAASPFEFAKRLPRAAWRFMRGKWPSPDDAVGTRVDAGYADWLKRRVSERAAQYPFRPEAGLFSLLTTVYDTPSEFLGEMIASVRRQTFAHFEWILLDNGSQSSATRRMLGTAAREDPRIRLLRVENNLGIVGGMRNALERASGRYLLPVDSDDRLFEDSLAIVASVVQREGYPCLLYSDEDKLRNGLPADPFLKPDWDPVLLRNCCYVAHLCVIERATALNLGVYSDAGAEGCHDWDTYLRFHRAGRSAVHIPEILYSWRMHARSTAADVRSKDYIVASHRHVLGAHVRHMAPGNRFEVQGSPFFPASPDWWVRRKHTMPPALELAVLVEGDETVRMPELSGVQVGYPNLNVTVVPWKAVSGFEQLRMIAARAAARRDPLVAVLFASHRPLGDEWAWEAIGLKESFPDALIIGGRVLDRFGRVRSAGEVFGYGGTLGSPDAGRAVGDPGYFGLALKQRSVSAVNGALCAVDPGFLDTVCRDLPESALRPAWLGAWLGACARLQGGRVVYSPFIAAQTLRKL